MTSTRRIPWLVCFCFDLALVQWRPETGPARARIEFSLRIEQRIATACTMINALTLFGVIHTRKRCFGTLAPADCILFWRQFPPPLFIAFRYLIPHDHP